MLVLLGSKELLTYESNHDLPNNMFLFEITEYLVQSNSVNSSLREVEKLFELGRVGINNVPGILLILLHIYHVSSSRRI